MILISHMQIASDLPAGKRPSRRLIARLIRLIGSLVWRPVCAGSLLKISAFTAPERKLRNRNLKLKGENCKNLPKTYVATEYPAQDLVNSSIAARRFSSSGLCSRSHCNNELVESKMKRVRLVKNF